jgi:hypothetical protein
MFDGSARLPETGYLITHGSLVSPAATGRIGIT